MKKTTIFLVLATLCLISKLNAQIPLRLTGQVSSSSGQPLSGATLSVTDTKLSTLTDQQGNFSFTTAPLKGTITVKYTGYMSSSISFGPENRSLKISLNSKENTLKDVQINAGYYSVKDKERTGTITKVTSVTISNQPVSNPLAALQGRVAGLVITQRNGMPGSDFNVQLRGKNSIQSGTSPLYLIDGVPFPSESLSQAGAVFANSPLNTLSPEDIESIEVLKDADATAIYGSRGANGVILITTKKGKTSSANVDFSLSTGMGRLTRTIELMDTREFLEMRREAFANDKTAPTLANAPDLLAWDQNRYTDFRDLLIGGTARTQNARLRLSGGNTSTNYALGANYYKETSVFPGEKGLDRKDASLNIQHQSSDGLFNLSLSTAYSASNNQLYASDLAAAMTLAPNAPPLYDEQGKLNWTGNGAAFNNPLSNTLESNISKTDRLNASAMLSYRILPGLEIRSTTGFSSISLNQFRSTPIAAQNPSSSPTGSSVFGDNLNQTYIIEPQLNYELNLGHHGKISMLLGATWQETASRSTLTSATGYTNDLLIGSIEAAVTKNPKNASEEYRYQAIFARLNYSLSGKYFINLTGRRDGSSRFGPGRAFANFGAVGMSWLFSQETPVKDLFPFLSFGKLRGSYGITGNDQISNYQYLDGYIPTPVYGGQAGLLPYKLFNENYGWESSTKLEANLELGFIRDRIRLSAGWFNNISSDQLVSYSLPGQTGFTSVLRNMDARIANRGLELELNTINIKGKKFSWNTTANMTFIRNRLLEFPQLESSSYSSTYVIGQPLGIIQGYRYTGINQLTGAYEFGDTNADGVINTADYILIGTKDPIFYGGISNSFSYGRLSVDVFLQFTRQKGSDLVYGSNNLVGNRTNAPRVLMDRWSPNNPQGRYQAFSQASSGPVNQARTLIRQSDAALVDASFIRIKNLAFSYSLPERLLKHIYLKTARVYAQAQNLFTLTHYQDLDPESQSATALPPIRMVSIGIQLTL